MKRSNDAKSKATKPAKVPAGSARGGVVKIFVADDHALVRELTVALFRKDPRFKVVGASATAEEAIRGCSETKPHVLILDVNFPGVSGVDAVPQLRQVAPRTRILLCSGSTSNQEVVTALQAGVEGFISKTGSPSELLTAVERVAKGDQYFCARTVLILAELTRLNQAKGDAADVVVVSAREKEVMQLIAVGDTSKEIAAKLGISLATVETHRRNVMVKAGARNTASLIRFGQTTGLLKAPTQLECTAAR